MSFLGYFYTHNQKTYKKQPIILHGKENIDSLLANHFPQIYYKKRERASAFTSKGSITVEAAVVVPIFFLAMLCLAYMLEITAIQTTVSNALHSAAKEFAEQAYVSFAFSAGDVESHVVENIGPQRLNDSIVVGGADGINCDASDINKNTGVLELSAKYEIKIPILMFQLSTISMEDKIRVKGWNGYASGAEERDKDTIVYVTDTGLVYHKEQNCTYLDLSIRAVGKEQVDDLRNPSGAKYHPCESCGKNNQYQGMLYITDYGTRYHTTLGCSRLTRNIYAVPLDEVYGLGGCSKCVK